ncbi:IQ domain-containing protein K-like [Anneissia japonica]|uniref:IQ domain-containing protein K-like n=1 Tax=Anneissia japonica TaxID=1529436 RepID=UPI001425A1B8|nr:IQ domain-containing protein K-like [Anneissia japonica]
MSAVVGKRQEQNLWEEICKEFAAMRPPFEVDDDAESVTTEIIDFDPSCHTPVLYGRMAERVAVDSEVVAEFDPAKSHPAFVGHTELEKPPKMPSPPPPPLPPKETCTPREYLEGYIFPVLLQGMLEMLKQAKKERCFERKRFRFNGCDFLTEYLWKHNPYKFGRENDNLDDIPFVHKILAECPRPALPLSLIWTEEEAAIVIQSFWRGYLVRRQEEVQELRVWQKELRDENEDIRRKVENFWRVHETPVPDDERNRRGSEFLLRHGRVHSSPPQKPLQKSLTTPRSALSDKR